MNAFLKSKIYGCECIFAHPHAFIYGLYSQRNIKILLINTIYVYYVYNKLNQIASVKSVIFNYNNNYIKKINYKL